MKKIKYKFAYYIFNDFNKKIINFLEQMLDDDWEIDEENPEYVFVLGGDGTFLHVFNQFIDKNVKLIGINSGTLGFYTIGNWNKISRQKNLSIFFQKSKHYFNPLILESKLYNNNDLIKILYSLNDLVIQSALTIKSKLYLDNNEFIDESASSGLVFCTPTGSSAINKSNNGPIFFSSLNAYCMSFIMPINNIKYYGCTNPFLFSKSETISWFLKNEEINFQIINDGVEINSSKVNKIEISLKNAKCQIFMPYDTVLALKHLKKFF